MDTAFALDDLFAHFVARCSGPPGRLAAQRWATAEPALAGITHPLDAVGLCQRSCDRRSSNDALGALVRLAAADELAALAALVALVPGLGRIAARLGRCVGVERASLEADLASAAWEVIRSLGEEAWPASVILSRTRDRVRAAANANSHRRSRDAGPGPLEGLAAGPGRPVVESLGVALGEVWRANPGARDGLALVFATRVWGTTPAEAARGAHLDVGALRARRARAERRAASLAQRCVVGVGAGGQCWAASGGRS